MKKLKSDGTAIRFEEDIDLGIVTFDALGTTSAIPESVLRKLRPVVERILDMTATTYRVENVSGIAKIRQALYRADPARWAEYSEGVVSFTMIAVSPRPDDNPPDFRNCEVSFYGVSRNFEYELSLEVTRYAGEEFALENEALTITRKDSGADVSGKMDKVHEIVQTPESRTVAERTAFAVAPDWPFSVLTQGEYSEARADRALKITVTGDLAAFFEENKQLRANMVDGNNVYIPFAETDMSVNTEWVLELTDEQKHRIAGDGWQVVLTTTSATAGTVQLTSVVTTETWTSAQERVLDGTDLHQLITALAARVSALEAALAANHPSGGGQSGGGPSGGDEEDEEIPDLPGFGDLFE